MRLVPAAALAAALLLAGCGSGALEPRPGEGAFQGTWGGKRWTGDAAANVSRGDTLRLFGTSPPGAGQLPTSYVRVTVVFRGVGPYTLGPEAAEVVHLVGGDAATARYATAEGAAGALRIENYSEGWMVGSVAFDAVSTYGTAPHGPRARFRGSFRARVHRRP